MNRSLLPAGMIAGVVFLGGLDTTRADTASDGPVATHLEQAFAEHWAFRGPVRPEVPAVQDRDALRTAVDFFIASALNARGLWLSAEADRPTLNRRVSFDLTGLPPSPTEVAKYLADSSADAYEQMVERYLASPHYGERWGKYWLDATGYADSNGYFNVDSDRPLAYRFRD